jgi:hypothetical protein
MPLTIDQRVNGGVDIALSQTVSVVNSAASPMIVEIIWEGTATITGVTFNGAALTSIVSHASTSNNQRKVQVWGILSPAIATANVVVSYSAAPGGGSAFHVITTTGGDTSTGWRSSFIRNDSNGLTPGITVSNAVSGDIVVHAGQVDTTTVTWGGSEITTNTSTNNVASSTFSGGMSTLAASGSTAVSFGTPVASYAEVAFALIPASGGPPPAALMGQRFYING